jgi:ribosomal-protein-alanine N-acetyltransferase
LALQIFTFTMDYTNSLTTERLKTRRLEHNDHKTWSTFFVNIEDNRFIPGDKETDPEKRAIHWIEWQLLRYKEKRFGLHALIEKHTGAFIGQCGLLLQEINGAPEIEIGYHILPEYRKQGFAVEAARVFKHYALRDLGLNSVVSLIHTDNIASQRVAEKNGMLREQELRIDKEDFYIYRITNNM